MRWGPRAPAGMAGPSAAGEHRRPRGSAATRPQVPRPAARGGGRPGPEGRGRQAAGRRVAAVAPWCGQRDVPDVPPSSAGGIPAREAARPGASACGTLSLPGVGALIIPATGGALQVEGGRLAGNQTAAPWNNPRTGQALPRRVMNRSANFAVKPQAWNRAAMGSGDSTMQLTAAPCPPRFVRGWRESSRRRATEDAWCRVATSGSPHGAPRHGPFNLLLHI